MFMIQILEARKTDERDIVDSGKALFAEMAFERLGVILIENLAPIAREVNNLKLDDPADPVKVLSSKRNGDIKKWVKFKARKYNSYPQSLGFDMPEVLCDEYEQNTDALMPYLQVIAGTRGAVRSQTPQYRCPPGGSIL
ncbi:hypothetical protein QCA50_013620 [Cerrena zonata]|uniref:Uncharacterized protein n=1 Tax=Cerrena zonata TaxID=2478898 RepID=A0AAW0G0C6_9APHY